MHPAVFDGVTKREERNGGAYSNTKRLTTSNTKITKKYTAESLAISDNVGGAADRSFHQANALHITRRNNTLSMITGAIQ